MTIHRSRIEQWLRAYAQSPLRLLVAPAGSGKTSTLVKHGERSESDVAYCSLPAFCDPQQMRERVAGALGVAVPNGYDAFVDAVCGSPAHCVEILIDDVDNGTPETIAELLRLVEDVRDNVSLVYAARSRERIHARQLIARGLAALCDARQLAFDAEEVARFAEACGSAYSALDVKRLVEDTDGWALAVAATVRVAAAEALTLPHAYAQWRSQASAFLDEFVANECDRVCAEDGALFAGLVAGTRSADRATLRALESRGLFVYDDGDVLRVYRVLRPYAAKMPASKEHAAVPPMHVRLFRSFEASIEGREVGWIRRRDQNIVKYLLLKADGKASRSEIAAVFWSETDKHLATQSVRTACSTIRKAFASIVGYAAVDSYFRTTPDVQIDFSHVVCDARRFSAHVADGDAAFERGDAESAAMHYRAADKLYAGDLLEFEAPEPWFVSQMRSLRERHLTVLERLSALCFEAAAYEQAQEYALRAHALAPEQPAVVTLLERLKGVRRARAASTRPRQEHGSVPARELEPAAAS